VSRHTRIFLSVLFNDAVKCEDYTVSMMEELMCTEHWSNDTNRGKTDLLREKLVPVPLCPP